MDIQMLRSCIFCGSFFAQKIACKHCWQTFVIGNASRNQFSEYSFPVYSLLSWNPGPKSSVGHLVRRLKKTKWPRSYHDLADEFIARVLGRSPEALFRLNQPVIVPCPGRPKAGQMDHASSFATEIGLLTGIPVEDLLIHAGGEKQRGKNYVERKKRKFKYRGPKWKPHRDVIFVDDVITTGSTAKAAQEVLTGRFQVWTLACRTSIKSSIKEI